MKTLRVVIAPDSNSKDQLLALLKKGLDMDTGKKNLNLKSFEFMDDGDIKTFLGININKSASSCLYISQPHLIAHILEAVGLTADKDSSRNTRATRIN